ncbi:hypothetical protein IWW39_004586 [Coemansia spiralis]|uniref:Uncharacterized protein n=2 Tax=Coemansia TaxID=4863 RepID=A0A9W8GGK4_9FUNG|nr:hypothetical protein IWW39_004586 [Coemansia spiralis]
MNPIDFAQPLAPWHMLDGDNYQLWKVLTLDILDRLKIRAAVKSPYLVTNAEWRELNEQKNSQAVVVILKCMKPDIAIEYCGITCPYELWVQLERTYGEHSQQFVGCW